MEWVPWLDAASKNFMAKNFGQEVDGYYWHPDRGEYLKTKPALERNWFIRWLRKRHNGG